VTSPRKTWSGLLLLAGLAGCGPAPAEPVDTGAREAVRTYYESVLRQDWRQAYDVLHPESQKRWPRDEFVRLAQAYRRNLGFEPKQVQIRSCDEQGAEATAHVVITGTSSRQRYNDAVVLRQHAGSWRVVLPNKFGRW
jgi:hypothetical protein